MKAKFYWVVLVVAIATLLVSVTVASALPTNKGIKKAKEVSPAIDDYTGELKAPPEFVADLPESELTKIVFIRYAPGKEPVCDYNDVCDKGEKWQFCPDCSKPGGEEEEPTTACYGFLAGSKPKWNWAEPYKYGNENLVGPSSSAVTTWEAPVLDDIFGAGSPGTYTWGSYDYINSISYDNYDDTGMCPTEDPCVIAVTAIWFRGKNIYEYDIMFDKDFFPGDSEGAYDLETVTLHEFGHGAGLDDLYDSVCSDNVMYGYYERVKTILGSGDITGIRELYGK